MSRILLALAVLPAASGLVAPAGPAASSKLMADASAMDGIQSPTGFFDPLGLSKMADDETLAWYRAAEIKHGRVAMAGFVGYCLQANGVKFPWAPFDAITATSPPEQWDALPDAAKWQIILGVGFLEWWSEIRCAAHPESLGVL